MATLTRDQCLRWHASHFVPGATTVIIVGDIDVDTAVRIVDASLAGWEGSTPTEVPVSDSAARTGRAVRVINRPAAPQSELRIGHVGIPRGHADYFDVVVMNAILGGVFNSRINMNLRKARVHLRRVSGSRRRDACPVRRLDRGGDECHGGGERAWPRSAQDQRHRTPTSFLW